MKELISPIGTMLYLLSSKKGFKTLIERNRKCMSNNEDNICLYAAIAEITTQICECH